MTSRNRVTTFFTLVALTLFATSAHAQLVWHLPLNNGANGTTLLSTGGADDVIDDASHGATDGAIVGSNAAGALWVNDASRGIVMSTGDNNRLNAGTQDINASNLYAWSVWVNNTEPIGPSTIMGNRGGGNTWSKLQVERLNANGATNVPFTPVNDGTWHHVVITGTSATNISAYVDGAFSGQDNSIGTIPTTALLHVGGNPSFAPSEDYTGLISDAAIWDESLSADEVKGLYDVSNSSGAGLLYDAGEFDLLKQVHDAGSGFVDIGDLRWTFSPGLVGAAGLSGSGTDFTLTLDATTNDTGLVSTSLLQPEPGAVVPEPTTILIAALGLLGMGWLGWRRRKRA